MNIDERLEALTMNLELLVHQGETQNGKIDKLIAESEKHSQQLEKDGDHIRALARIAEIHHERLVRLEEKS